MSRLALGLVTLGLVLAVVAVILDVSLGRVALGRIAGWVAMVSLGGGLFLRFRERRAASHRREEGSRWAGEE
jgi:hypothetical protein